LIPKIWWQLATFKTAAFWPARPFCKLSFYSTS
jgi:hypothetical protein